MAYDVELCFTPAYELAAAIRAKRVSPVEVMEAVLGRLETVNPKLNAFVVVDAEGALAAAREAEAAVVRGEDLGPLHGLPVSVKDLVPVAGMPTRYGSRTSPAEPTAEDGLVPARLRRAGAIIFGKTTTPEYGCKGFTDSPLTGVTHNPWDLSRSSGGSSGGAGAAVAAGIGPLAIGTDGGGSIRIPSACCGIFGLKATRGRVPNYPSPNAWSTFSHTGPMVRAVRDAALLLGVIAGPDARDPLGAQLPVEDWESQLGGDLKGMRVAWSPDLGYASLHPEVRRLTTAAAEVFTALGAAVEPANPGFASPHDIFMTLYTVNYAARLGPLLPEHRDEMDPYLVGMIERGQRTSAADYYRVQMRQTALYLAMERFLEGYDLLLTPLLGHPALPYDFDITKGLTVDGVHFPEFREGYYPFTFPFNLTGHPAAAVPCGFTTDGLPVSLQIVGHNYAEGQVLKAAAAFEAARPWAQRRPAL